mmetsp:Transcript_175653/g.563307  ORF Transcript_175653/g.563307 Transcript_175653/m.563307 type:complete len:384 (+) Transcript_175653:122-1273(+)
MFSGQCFQKPVISRRGLYNACKRLGTCRQVTTTPRHLALNVNTRAPLQWPCTQGPRMQHLLGWVEMDYPKSRQPIVCAMIPLRETTSKASRPLHRQTLFGFSLKLWCNFLRIGEEQEAGEQEHRRRNDEHATIHGYDDMHEAVRVAVHHEGDAAERQRRRDQQARQGRGQEAPRVGGEAKLRGQDDDQGRSDQPSHEVGKHDGGPRFHFFACQQRSEHQVAQRRKQHDRKHLNVYVAVREPLREQAPANADHQGDIGEPDVVPRIDVRKQAEQQCPKNGDGAHDVETTRKEHFADIEYLHQKMDDEHKTHHDGQLDTQQTVNLQPEGALHVQRHLPRFGRPPPGGGYAVEVAGPLRARNRTRGQLTCRIGAGLRRRLGRRRLR